MFLLWLFLLFLVLFLFTPLLYQKTAGLFGVFYGCFFYFFLTLCLFLTKSKTLRPKTQKTKGKKERKRPAVFTVFYYLFLTTSKTSSKKQ